MKGYLLVITLTHRVRCNESGIRALTLHSPFSSQVVTHSFFHYLLSEQKRVSFSEGKLLAGLDQTLIPFDP